MIDHYDGDSVSCIKEFAPPYDGLHCIVLEVSYRKLELVG